MKKIKTAIVGAGNCASSLVQGAHFYGTQTSEEDLPGLMHPSIGEYGPGDLEFVAAFDINDQKVGRDLSEALLAAPNNTAKFCDVPHLGVEVLRGPTMDGLGMYLGKKIKESKDRPVDVAKILRSSNVDVLVSYLPVGSEAATRWYAEQALEAGCAFVNCIPVFIASDPEWQKRFAERRLPLVGDDVKSQVGATIVHRILTDLFKKRGVRLDRTYQLNFGGNADFLNMLERERLESKKISKTQAVTSQLGHPMPSDNVHVGPSDYVPWLEDRKWCHIRMEGSAFGGMPLQCEVKLEVWDSPNSAGVVIDAIRCAKLALDHGIGGVLHGPSAYFMKSPPVQYTDEDARLLLEEFLTNPAEFITPQRKEVHTH